MMEPLEEQQIRDAGRGHLLGTSQVGIAYAIDKARRAQQDHDRRNDVQLEMNLTPDDEPAKLDE